MKKSLFALAAVTAFAGAAQAQSSVTVYGILDVGYIGGNAKVTQSGKTNQETVSLIGQSAQNTSRLGFRGTEDLGGGMSAFFTFETGLQPNQSTLSTFDNRQALVGLAQKGVGRVSVGTLYTPLHTVIGRTSAGNYNNIVGDVIYPQNRNLSAVNNTNQITAGYTVRTNNTINLQSEVIAGFQATGFYSLNNKDQNQTQVAGVTTAGGTTNQNAYGIGLTYSLKKLFVAANYQSFKNETDATATAAVTGTNATDNQMYFAAAYDFGIVKAYAQYIDRKVTSNLNSNQYAKRSAQQIGVKGNWTPKIESWASVGTGRIQTFGLGEPTANFTGYQLGTSYFLSKRTNLYGIFGSNQSSSVSSVASSANNSYSANNYAVGVRHTF
jgi:predicted porin